MSAGSFSGYIGSYRFFKPYSLKTTLSTAADDEMRSTRVTTLNTLLDEEVRRLRGSVSAYKGHLTKAYSDIRFLCSNSGSLSEIVSRKSALDDLFARYTAAVQSLLQKLVDLEEQERTVRNYNHEANEKDVFDEESTKLINSVRQLAFIDTGLAHVCTSTEFLRRTPPELPHGTQPGIPRETPPELPRGYLSGFPRETPPYVSFETTPPELPRETPPVTPRDLPRETPHEQLHQRGPGSTASGFCSYGSRRSRTSRSSKTKLAVAQLKIKELEDEQRLKTMEHDLQKQRLQLEMERQLLNARVEVEQTQIELSVGSGDSSDIGNRPQILPSLPKQTLYETVDRYRASYENYRPRSALTLLLQPEKILAGTLLASPKN